MIAPMRSDLPSGTVTFLFTDVEGSTRLLHELGDKAYEEALAEHRRVIRGACAARGGVEVDTQGDAFFFAFPTAPGAIAAASALTDELAGGRIQVRIGLHTGNPRVSGEGYVGMDVHFAARVAAAGHGGQIVLSKATHDALDDLELTDLGEHRLKDIPEAVAIYQYGNQSFPPLKTISNTNLPRPASSFVGREGELADVIGRIEGGARLLTLTGPGGSGKTRLALEAASTLVPEYKAGVFWVGLAPLRDHALVTETIAQTLGAKGDLQEHIAERELLLLLDNLEQVIESAPELSALVTSCPNLTLLCTSRELLRVSGEVEYPVPPLQGTEAVSLFCERSGLEASEEIAELCANLDALPLGVELASARAKVLSPAQILERLSQRLDLLKGGRDADPRQQTLRATIEWSYELLVPEEQVLFARLAVFRGCTLEAAEEVCGADLDTLQSLVEKSLLRFANERYWMLETIREYADERLQDAGEAQELRRRHGEYFLALAEEAFNEATGRSRPWLDRLEADHDNLRAVLDWFESVGRTREALQLAGALSRFWSTRGYLVEGGVRLERLLAREPAPTTDRVRALNGAAVIAYTTGDQKGAERRAEEARDLASTLGDAWGEAYAVYALGMAATERGDWSDSLSFFEASLDKFRRLGEDQYVLAAMDGIAWASRKLGDRERSKGLHEETLEYARAGGYSGLVVMQLWQLAELATEEGRPREALAMLREALVLNRDERNLRTIPEVLVVMAGALQALSAPATATTLLAAAARLREEIGGGIGWVGGDIERLRGRLRDSLGDAGFESAWEEGRALSTDEAIGFALEETELDA
jgi:predicted ATPase/class 3 adenylate cyclase